jgi:hypothetical protein
MEPITPEERWAKIDQLLNQLAELRARHNAQPIEFDKELAELRQRSQTLMPTFKAMPTFVMPTFVMPPFIEDRAKADEWHRKSQERRKIIDEKLRALVEKVDRLYGKEN